MFRCTWLPISHVSANGASLVSRASNANAVSNERYAWSGPWQRQGFLELGRTVRKRPRWILGTSQRRGLHVRAALIQRSIFEVLFKFDWTTVSQRARRQKFTFALSQSQEIEELVFSLSQSQQIEKWQKLTFALPQSQQIIFAFSQSRQVKEWQALAIAFSQSQ